MEIAPELQFKHYTVAEARLPADVLMHVPQMLLSEVAICCDLERHVFYAAHTDPGVVEALSRRDAAMVQYLIRQHVENAARFCQMTGQPSKSATLESERN